MLPRNPLESQIERETKSETCATVLFGDAGKSSGYCVTYHATFRAKIGAESSISWDLFGDIDCSNPQ